MGVCERVCVRWCVGWDDSNHGGVGMMMTPIPAVRRFDGPVRAGTRAPAAAAAFDRSIERLGGCGGPFIARGGWPAGVRRLCIRIIIRASSDPNSRCCCEIEREPLLLPPGRSTSKPLCRRSTPNLSISGYHHDVAWLNIGRIERPGRPTGPSLGQRFELAWQRRV